MNKNQRISLGVGLAVFIISLLFVPWKWESRDGRSSLEDGRLIGTGRTPFWNVEKAATELYGGPVGGLNAPAMLLDWAIIVMLTGGAILLLKKPNE